MASFGSSAKRAEGMIFLKQVSTSSRPISPSAGFCWPLAVLVLIFVLMTPPCARAQLLHPQQNMILEEAVGTRLFDGAMRKSC